MPQTAERLGFDAVVAGPDPDFESDLMKRLLAPTRNGFNLVNLLFRETLIPAIAPAVHALTPLVADSDLFISHTIQLAAPVVARRTGVSWVSASPAALVYPTALAPPPGVAWRGSPAFVNRFGWIVGRRLLRPLDALANAEFAALGAKPITDVVLGGAYSRRLTFGLWSPSYFPRPDDWPDWFQVGGYGRWDAPPTSSDDAPVILTFPDPLSHAPLIVFTLGSSVVSDPRGFYEMALKTLAPTPWRALLVGAPDDLPIPINLRDRVKTIPYAPFADVLPRATAVVHSGGVGTTQACAYYGKPAVIVPRAADQFENAAHVQREGWGLRLLPHDLSPTPLRLRLERLLRTPSISRRVEELGVRMRAENGPAHSADLLEDFLR